MFVTCGLNHKTAPIHIREHMAMPTERQQRLLEGLTDLPTVKEALLLSTCNRTEIYCDTTTPELILPWIAEQQRISPSFLGPHTYEHHGYHGIRHTLRVASGLDSMMLGEPQILGQMKQAYQQACALGTIKNRLHHIFQYIFSASKHIRSVSGIGKNPVSIAYAAAQLITHTFHDIERLNIMLIGSGETTTLVAKYLLQQGAKHFMITSRTPEHAAHLAATIPNASIFTITDIPTHLTRADVVISATACPLPFISKALVEQALNTRYHAPMFFLDLAVPRDIEPNVAQLDHVHLYNIDDMHTLINRGMDERRQAAQHAETLVHQALDTYERTYRSRKQAGRVIRDYRARMQNVAQQELQRSLQKLSTGHDHTTVLSEFSERLIKKLMHTPTIGLRQAAWDNRQDLLDLAHYLLNETIS